MTHAELDRKFIELSSKSIGAQAAHDIAAAVATLDSADGVEALMRMLSDAVAAHARQ
jgi:hypothetical protein